jgi:hypothetical protein
MTKRQENMTKINHGLKLLTREIMHFLRVIEGSMAKQSKFENRASRIGELKTKSTSWNNAIHRTMKITHSCVLSLACYNMKW